MTAKILVTFALLAAEPAAEAPPQEPPVARASVALEGKSPQELVSEGSRYFADGDYDGAISRWGWAGAHRPNSPEVDLNLGLAHLRKGEHDRAADYFIAAASKGAGRLASKASFNLGGARVGQGRFEDAVEAYEDALRADPGNDDARHNLGLVLAHIERLKELEKKRKEAEEEFRKRLEALMKEIREIVEAQAGAVQVTWATEPNARGALPAEDDAKKLKELASEGKPLPDDLAAKLARALVKGRGKEAKASSGAEIAKTEREISKRARGAAKTAAFLASDLKRASGAPPKGTPQPPSPPGQPSQQTDKSPENPLIGKLERAGGALVEGASKVRAAAAELDGGSIRKAEPAEALGLWKFVKALGELASPPEHKGGMSEELKKILKRMAELRRRQGELVLDVWASAPASRGRLPDADEQKAFWAKVRAAEALTDAERVPLARLEILGSGRTGEKRPSRTLAEDERGLAVEARGLATEAEALAAKQGGGEKMAGLVGMLRGSAEAMDAAAGFLASDPAAPVSAARAEPDLPAAPKPAEGQALLAFVRLSRAPDQLQELLARLGAILGEQMTRLLDTWRSDAASRGPVPTPDELKSAQEEIAKALKEGSELDPELEAKLGRLVPGMIEKRSGGKAAAGQAPRKVRPAPTGVGASRKGDEAGRLQGELVPRAREAVSDMRRLATQGAKGQMNPAAPMLEGAAKDVEGAAVLMEGAAAALPRSFKEAEPSQARAVASLMRALSRFASGAAGQSGEQGDQQKQQQAGEKKDAEKKEGEKKEGTQDEKRAGERKDDEKARKEDRKKAKAIDKERAARLLEEAAQQERDVRRDMRKRTGRKAIRVKRDW